MENLRKPFFIAALVLMAVVVLVEVGATAMLDGRQVQPAAMEELLSATDFELDAEQQRELNALASQDKPPGLAIPYLALIDGILLFTVALMSVSLLVRERIHGRVQGLATLIFSLLLIIAAVVMIVAAIAAVTVMVSLFLAVPFGTLTYLALFGFFDQPGAALALGLLMILKLEFVVCLVLAQQRFLQNKGLVMMILTSFVCTVIVSFLHGLVPPFLVSITDGIAAIVVAVIAVLWAIYLLIRSLPAVIKAFRFDRAL